MDLAEILERTQQIADGVVTANAVSVDRDATWPEEGLRAIQQAGLGGLVVPKELGGLGQGLLGLAQVCETLGRRCPSTALCFGMHCVGAAVISARARPEQQHYLDAICGGQHLTTLALSEYGSGAHFYFPGTQLISNPDNSLRLNGSKHFVTNGGYADSYVVSTVAADPDAPANLFSCVVVPAGVEGLDWGKPWDGLGMRGNSSRSVELRDIVVQPCNLLGEEGDQIWYVFNVVAPYFLMAMAGTYLGISQTAFDEASNHISERTFAHSGATLAQVSILQHRLGSLWTSLERTRRLVYFAATEADEDGPVALPALCGAKADVAECVVRVVNDAMTLCGGIAYRNQSRLGQLLRDARAAHVMAPTTDILLTWAGRAVLGQPLLGD